MLMKKKRWLSFSAWVTFELFFFTQIVSAGNIVVPSPRHSHLRAPSLKGTAQDGSRRDVGVSQFLTELRGVKDGGTQNLESFPSLLRDYLKSVAGVIEGPDWLRQTHALFTSVYPRTFLADLEKMRQVPEPTGGTVYSRLDTPLYYDAERGFVVLVASWEPGQSTHIHNHLTENEEPEEGIIGVLEGEAEVVHFRREGNRIIEAGRFILKEGQAAIVRQEAGQIHRVRNAGNTRLVMLDTYRPRLTRTDVFLPLEDHSETSLLGGKKREAYVVEPVRIPAGKQNLLLPKLLVEAGFAVPQIDEFLRSPITVKATLQALNEAKALIAGRDGGDKRQPAKESTVEIAGATFLHLSAERPVETVLIPEPIDPAVIRLIQERDDVSAFILTPGSEEVRTPEGWKVFSQDQLLETVRQTNPTAIIGYTNLLYNAQLMDLAPRLEGIYLFSTGRENVSHLEARRRGIFATFVPGPLTEMVTERNHTFGLNFVFDYLGSVLYQSRPGWMTAEEVLSSTVKENPESVAQWIWGELLRRSQRLDRQVDHVKQGKFRRTTGVSENATVYSEQLAHNPEIGIETTLGLIGLGEVGKRLAEIAKVFELKEVRYHVPPKERDKKLEKELGLVYVTSVKDILTSNYVIRVPGAPIHLTSVTDFRQEIVDPERIWTDPDKAQNLLKQSLFGRRAHIAGLGQIGRETARRAIALGMDVDAIEIRPDLEAIEALNQFQSKFAERHGRPKRPIRLVKDKEAFFKEANPGDLFFYQFNYTPEVHHWVDAEALALLGDTPVIHMNTARGKLVDTKVMEEYLDTHPHSKYGTDVLENETGETEKGLAERPNVVVTPHSASADPRVRAYVQKVAVVDNFFAFLDGKIPANPMPEVPVHEVVARRMFREAVKSADAYEAVRRHVAYDPSSQTLTVQGRPYDLAGIQNIYVVGYGKASGEMAEALTEILGERITSGVITVAGHEQKKRFNGKIKPITVYAGDHPIPGLEGPKGTEEMIALVHQAEPQDMVISLISGGGSAIGAHPVFKMSLKDLQTLYQLLESTPIPIHEKNVIRKHLDARADLLRVSRNAKHFVSLIISDVPGDDPRDIASGYTVGDTSTFRDVKELLQKYHLWGRIPASIRNFIEQNVISDPVFEQVHPEDPLFKGGRVHTALLVGNRPALERAAEVARALGYETKIIEEPLSRTVEAEGVQIVEEIIEASDSPREKPLAILWGGETVVDLPESPGRGGRNSHLAMTIAKDLFDLNLPEVTFLAASTDGKDGSWDGTGAVVTGETVARAQQARMELSDFLRRFDSGTFAEKTGIDVTTGPTGTNVMDVAIALIPAGMPEEAREGGNREAIRSAGRALAGLLRSKLINLRDAEKMPAELRRALSQDVHERLRQQLHPTLLREVGDVEKPVLERTLRDAAVLASLSPEDPKGIKQSAFLAGRILEDINQYASSSASLRASWHAPRDPSGKVMVDPRYEEYRKAIWKSPSHWNFKGIRGLLEALEEETLRETLRQFAASGETFVVAEIGTGNGPLTQELLEMFKRFSVKNYKILATDVNASWLASAYERYGDKKSPHYDPSVEFYLVRSEDEQGRSFRDFEKLSTTLGGQKVHLVIGSHAIHLIGQFDQFAAGVRETLLPGGFAAFQSLNVEYPGRVSADGTGPFLIDDTANRVHDLAVELIRNDARYAGYRERVSEENIAKALQTRRAVFPPVRDQSEYLTHLKDHGFGILVPYASPSYPAEYIHVLYEDWGEFLKLELLQNGILPELHKTPVQSEVIAEAAERLFEWMRRENEEKRNPFTSKEKKGSFIVGSTIIIAKLGREERSPVEPERFARDGGRRGLEIERREALVAYLDGILDATPTQGPGVISLDVKVEQLASQFALPPETVKRFLGDSDVFQILPDGQITFDRSIGEDSEALRFFAMTAKKWIASARDGGFKVGDVKTVEVEETISALPEEIANETDQRYQDGRLVGREGFGNIIDAIEDRVWTIEELLERLDRKAEEKLRPELSPLAKALLRQLLIQEGTARDSSVLLELAKAIRTLDLPSLTAGPLHKDLESAKQIVKEVLVGL